MKIIIIIIIMGCSTVFISFYFDKKTDPHIWINKGFSYNNKESNLYTDITFFQIFGNLSVKGSRFF